MRAVPGWIAAAFLAANLSLVLLRAADILDWAPVNSFDKSYHLDGDLERSFINAYHGALLGVIAALAAAHVARAGAGRPRWLAVLGWPVTALGFAFLAFAELTGFMDISDRATLVRGWLILPVAAMAGWTLLRSQWRRPPRALLTAIALAAAGCAVIRDVMGHLYSLIYSSEVTSILEENYEMMAWSILVVVLISSLIDPHPRTRPRNYLRIAGATTGGVLGLVALALGVFALTIEHHADDTGWTRAVPHVYTGPVSLVEQSIRVDHDYLSRLEVWVFVDGNARGHAEIFARLTPQGSTRPIRESRAVVSHKRFSNATVNFDFEPISDSGGKSYNVAIGVLSGPEPWVFLGLAGDDPNPHSEVVIAGTPTRYDNDLAMGTYWLGHGARVIRVFVQDDPRRVVLLGDIALTVSLWIFVIAAGSLALGGAERTSRLAPDANTFI